jgi:ribosomal protein S18 acetylase RimI-like enzyme
MSVNMTKAVVTLANINDLDVVSSMFDLYRQFYDQPSDVALAKTFIAERIENNESIIFIAKDSSADALGFCQIYPSFCSVEATRIYKLYDMFVHPHARRCGAGRALLLAAEKHAKDNGVVRLDLETARGNRTAQRLYESLNWVKDNEFLTYNRRVPT